MSDEQGNKYNFSSLKTYDVTAKLDLSYLFYMFAHILFIFPFYKMRS